MNTIAETWTTKVSGKIGLPKSPAVNNGSPDVVQSNSWRYKMLAKVKECRDTIKNMMAFDKLANSSKMGESIHGEANNVSILSESHGMSAMYSIPDIISFRNNALKRNDSADEHVLMRNSSFNSDESEKLNASFVHRKEESTSGNDSSCGHPSMNEIVSSSLKSFLALEKQIEDEFLDEKNVFTGKKKISAEPFLSYNNETGDFAWLGDTTDDVTSSSDKARNFEEHLNSTGLTFEEPLTNSSFYEYDHMARKADLSSSGRSLVFRDSGVENN